MLPGLTGKSLPLVMPRAQEDDPRATHTSTLAGSSAGVKGRLYQGKGQGWDKGSHPAEGSGREWGGL